MNIRPLTGALGAEIVGVDLSRELDRDTVAQIRDAWLAHAVLVFRAQYLTPADQVRFTRYFGEPRIHWLGDSLLPEQPEIMRVSNVRENGKPIGVWNAGRFWHSDLSYVEVPDRGGFLYAVEIPRRNGKPLGDTRFSSTCAAYDALPDSIRKRVDGLCAVFSVDKRNQMLKAARDSRTVPDSSQASAQQAVHPVIRVHPDTGRRCIYVSEGHASGILDLDPDEGERLIALLAEHLQREEFVYRHRWAVGDLIMWDNIPTQHIATFDYQWPQRRLLHRTTIQGRPEELLG